MVKRHHSPETKILIVCGSDKAEKGRKDDHIYMARESNPLPGFVPTPKATARVSATLVREILGRAKTPDAGVQQLLRGGLVPDVVGEYIASNSAAFAGIFR